MYLPKHNQIEDQSQIFEFMKTHSFGVLVTSQNDLPFATHLPFFLDESCGPHGTLTGHLARANSQWHQFCVDKPVLVIFQGAHTYISPRWYESQFNVPTWNYAAVHAYGTIHTVDQEADVARQLDQLVAQYEGDDANAWSVPWEDERYGKLAGGVVTFEIKISRLEGKLKISQNKSYADQQSVIEHLQQTTSPDAVTVASMMCHHLTTEEKNDYV